MMYIRWKTKLYYESTSSLLPITASPQPIPCTQSSGRTQRRRQYTQGQRTRHSHRAIVPANAGDHFDVSHISCASSGTTSVSGSRPSSSKGVTSLSAIIPKLGLRLALVAPPWSTLSFGRIPRNKFSVRCSQGNLESGSSIVVTVVMTRYLPGQSIVELQAFEEVCPPQMPPLHVRPPEVCCWSGLRRVREHHLKSGTGVHVCLTAHYSNLDLLRWRCSRRITGSAYAIYNSDVRHASVRKTLGTHAASFLERIILPREESTGPLVSQMKTANIVRRRRWKCQRRGRRRAGTPSSCNVST